MSSDDLSEVEEVDMVGQTRRNRSKKDEQRIEGNATLHRGSRPAGRQLFGCRRSLEKRTVNHFIKTQRQLGRCLHRLCGNKLRGFAGLLGCHTAVLVAAERTYDSKYSSMASSSSLVMRLYLTSSSISSTGSRISSSVGTFCTWSKGYCSTT